MKSRCLLLVGGLVLVMTAAHAAGPKNVIVLVGDGRGFNHVDAGSLYRYGAKGTEVFQQPEWINLGMSTWSADGHGYDPDKAWADPEWVKGGATDSAAAATALATGIKTYNAAIGVDHEKAALSNLVQDAESLGKSTGVVSSVPLSHATPAGFVAHNVSRNNYAELAAEMVNKSTADVVIGAGHPDYNDNGELVDAEDRKYQYVGGDEVWQNLRAGRAGADADADGKADPWLLVETRAGFERLANGQLKAKRVFGVAPVGSTLQQGRGKDRVANANVPSLAVLAKGALNVLSANPQGFFLMIEGGAIDWAAHGNDIQRTVEEVVSFNETVEAVVAWVADNGGWDRNLVVVTGDHETGYLTAKTADGKVDASLPLDDVPAGALPAVEFRSGGHTNSLIPFAARGVGAERYAELATGYDPRRGFYLDNTDVPNVIRELWGGRTAAAALAVSPDVVDRFEEREEVGADGQKLLYRLYRPLNYNPTRQYPLVLFLHGAGGRGNDNQGQINDQPGALDLLTNVPWRLKRQAFIIAPQVPADDRWVRSDWSIGSYSQADTPMSSSVSLTLAALRSLESEFSIDSTRRYVMGMSMGGYGAWDMITRRPDLFAAAVPICGGGDATVAAHAASVPVWAFHGDQDGAVPVEGSRSMIAALKAAGADPKYTEYAGVGHDSWKLAFADEKMWDWLFDQRR